MDESRNLGFDHDLGSHVLPLDDRAEPSAFLVENRARGQVDGPTGSHHARGDLLAFVFQRRCAHGLDIVERIEICADEIR